VNPIINMVVRRLANALLRWFMRRQGTGASGGMGPRGGGRKRGGRRW
jgi:hypothetical protein